MWSEIDHNIVFTNTTTTNTNSYNKTSIFFIRHKWAKVKFLLFSRFTPPLISSYPGPVAPVSNPVTSLSQWSTRMEGAQHSLS